MNRVLLREAIKLNRARKRRKIWQNTVRCLAAGVVFCTTYALILPAITLNREAVCGVEPHEHSQECYVRQQTMAYQCQFGAHAHSDVCRGEDGALECGYGDVVIHSHNQFCYNSEGSLVCGLEEIREHIHGDACYTLSAELVCTVPEEPAHIHDGSCGSEEPVLVCQLEENGEHIHTDDCYQLPELTCQLQETEGHTHTEACYQTVAGLICQKPQVELHTHDENCRDENGILICQIPQTVIHDHEQGCVALTEAAGELLVCGMEEHIHEDGCYPAEEPAETENPYLCLMGAHAHGPDCYDETELLVCTIPEHAHEAACLVEELDMSADVETRAQWEAQLNALSYTGVWAEDVLTVAQSQLGYRESGRNVILDENGVLRGYTRYGEWYGDHYGDWCAMFVSFCLNYAGVEGFPQEAHCPTWIAMLKEQGLYRDAGAYEPKPGDVIFFDWDQSGEPEDADHVGIVAELLPGDGENPARIRTIEGNSAEQVENKTYNAGDASILGYGELPGQVFYCCQVAHSHGEGCLDAAGETVCGRQAHIHSKSCWDLGTSYELNGRPLECGEDHVHGDACYGDALASFFYQDETVTMNVTVVSAVGIPNGIQLEVIGLSDEDYASYASYAQENSAGAVTELTGYRFRFLLAGEEIALEEAQITVELTLNSAASEAADEETDGLVVKKTVAGGENLLLQSNRSGEIRNEGGEENVQSADTVSILSEENGAVATRDVLDAAGEDRTVVLELGSGRSIALMSASAPEFTVEYYAIFPQIQYSSSKPSGNYLEIIDTRGKGDGTGGSLPTNSGSTTVTGTDKGVVYLRLVDTGRTNTDRVSPSWNQSGNAMNTYGTPIYKIMTVDTLTEVYTSEAYTYSAGINIKHLDSLHENTHYELLEVWVSSDNGATWTAYTESGEDVTANGYTVTDTVQVAEIHEMEFTNNPDNESDALIRDGDLVRMVYDLVEGIQHVSANMFDYDISNGNAYTKSSSGNTWTNRGTPSQAISFVNSNSSDDGKIYMRTVDGNGGNQGINSTGSYVKSNGSAYLAFGNSNTGVTYRTHTRNSLYINQANQSGFRLCHFGLVTDYNILTDTLTYASGINHQALFNDEAYYMSQIAGYSVSGKTSYYRQRLDFTRTGDTYVLTSVNGGTDELGNGISAKNLDEFNYTYTNVNRPDLLSNNFWPMDGTAGDSVSGKDMMFGSYSDYSSAFRKTFNASAKSTTTLPLSDDGFAHNSYFGMQFSVEFSLDGHYCGPLEYLFYGDDDMWVFLTDLETGESQLICDIGGVHSSVGSFADLWDYIPRDSKNTYRLTFFYTERGASGSTCYMEFTLPEVTSITQNTPTTGSVSVSKEAVNESTLDAEYTFRLDLQAGANIDSGLNDNYHYEISGKSGSRTGTISSGGTFTMKADETFTVVGIPEGLIYTITEVFASGMEDAYNVSWIQNTGATVNGASITGTVQAAKTHSFTATNHAAGSLALTKEVIGAGTDGTFTFLVELKDGEGNPVSGTYGAYTFDGEGRLAVSVKHGQTVTLTNLPVGTVWSVTEESAEGFVVTYTVDGTEVDTATGVIGHDQTAAVKVVNSTEYTLPNTGGQGTLPYTFGGLLITAAAIMYICEFRHKRRKGGV